MPAMEHCSMPKVIIAVLVLGRLLSTLVAATESHSDVTGRRFRLVMVDDANQAADRHKRSTELDFELDPTLFNGFLPEEGVENNGTVKPGALLNPIADFIVRLTRKEIVKRGKEQIDIPDINKTAYKGVGPLKVKINFNATNGWFRNLASLQRTKDVVAVRSGSAIVLEIGMGLRTMVFGYDQYKAKVGPLHAEGALNGTVSNNSMTIKFSVDVGEQHCNVTLLDLTIDLLGKIKVKLNGTETLNWMYSKITNWVVNKYSDKIVPKAEEILQNNVQKLFRRIKCGNDSPDIYK